MTNLELEKMYIKKDDITFTPRFTFKDYVYDSVLEDYRYIGFTITKTAEEVYQEWLKKKEQIDICSEEIKTNEQLTEELKLSQQAIVDLEIELLVSK